jgi:hypothetical protein
LPSRGRIERKDFLPFARLLDHGRSDSCLATPSSAQLIMRRCPVRFPDGPPTPEMTGLVSGEKARRGRLLNSDRARYPAVERR